MDSTRSRSKTGDSIDITKSSIDPANVALTSELLELLGGVLARMPKLLSQNSPGEVIAAIESIKQRDNTGGLLWDPKSLTPHERARVLRDGVALGAVDPACLAAHLGKQNEADLREAFCSQWISGWLRPYLDARRDVFGPAPQVEKRSMFSRRNPTQQHGRQCGRVIIDGMRELFGKAMRLAGVEQEATARLLEEFAHVLCLEPEIQARFQFVVLPDEERPKDVESMEHAVFLLSYSALLLNTGMHNPSARGKVQTRVEFTTQGRQVAGFRDDFCKKMYDLVKAQPLGL